MKLPSVNSIRLRLFLGLFTLLVTGILQAKEPQPSPLSITLSNREINESSGLVASHNEAGIFWTLNDSGDSARIFSFDRKGQHRQEITIVGAENLDWESMASYRLGTKGQILIADVGDNALKREHVTIYRIEEPSLADGSVEVAQTIKVRYPDGSKNCEAIAADMEENQILLVAKAKSFSATVYSIPLDAGESIVEHKARKVAVASLPMVTGMDIHPQDGSIVLLTYADAFLYSRKHDTKTGRTDWPATFAQTPQLIPLPLRRQGEAVCFDPSGQSLWLTSEKRPTPLFNVALTKLDTPVEE